MAMAASRMNILTLNVGSSSLKFAVYHAGQGALELYGEGMIDMQAKPVSIRYRTSEGKEYVAPGDENAPLATLLRLPPLRELELTAVAHRIVHGGPWLREHCLIDQHVLARIEQAADFAPLHVPPALTWIAHARDALPHARHVACFDTAFHHPLPDLARILPLPRSLLADGVERYGFHGLSCESIVDQLSDPLPARLVIAHLGSGASLTAVENGRSIDTTMGMTPTGGIVMGTRPGDLDPGVLLYLLRQRHIDPKQLEHLLEKESGLRGLSDETGDARVLAEEAGRKPLAASALEHFAQSTARHIAGLAIVLGGLDLLVFTGGIGEHDASMRERVELQLRPIFPALTHRVLPSRENLMMARHAQRLLAPLDRA